MKDENRAQLGGFDANLTVVSDLLVLDDADLLVVDDCVVAEAEVWWPQGVKSQCFPGEKPQSQPTEVLVKEIEVLEVSEVDATGSGTGTTADPKLSVVKLATGFPDGSITMKDWL